VESYGSPEENPEFWKSLSANYHLPDLSGPVQLHHGTSDSSVPLEFSATLYEQILDAGGLVEFYEYKDDDHNIANSFSVAMTRSILFFDRFLLLD
jgi:dipeptidyl aminopeptidase/acylaminoacyl peptidase